MVYDVIIAGGSFAGLAVASQLRGWRVLILDRKPIGTGQTSACGTILPVLEHWHAEESVLQVHHSLFLHTGGRDIEFKSPYPWCTFDYARLCHILLGRTGAEVCQAAVTGLMGHIVHTTAGDFEGRCLVDASGWRAVLASALQPGFAHQGVKGKNYFDFKRECLIGSESLVIFEDGEEMSISTEDEGARFLLISGKPIREPVAWYGPIVMNTQEELRIAFEEYQRGAMR